MYNLFFIFSLPKSTRIYFFLSKPLASAQGSTKILYFYSLERERKNNSDKQPFEGSLGLLITPD